MAAWTPEQKAAQSERARQRWAAKKAEESQSKADVAVATVHTAAAAESLRSITSQLEAAKDALAKQLRVNDSVKKGMTTRVSDALVMAGEAEGEVSRLEREAKTLKGEISERLVYKEQQEKEIADVVERGNDRLYEIDQEVKELLRKQDDEHQKVADLEQQKADLERDKKNLELNCGVAEAKLDELKLRYDKAAATYRSDLVDIRRLIAEEQEVFSQLKARGENITAELVLKGKALATRENALATRDAELTSRERLLKSRESRYS